MSAVSGNCTRMYVGEQFVYTSPPTPALTEAISDDVGPDTDHPMNLVRRAMYAKGLSGLHIQDGVPSHWWRFDNFRPEGYDTPGSIALSNAASFPPLDINALAAKLLANSNPSRADVDLSVSIGELKNTPKAVFESARDFFRDVTRSRELRRLARSGTLQHRRNPIQDGAGGYLGVMFGLLPLVSDVKGLLNSRELIANRLAEIENLRSGDGMRKKLQLDSLIVKGQPENIYVTTVTGLTIKGMAKPYSTRKIWGTARWVPDNTFVLLPKTDRGRMNEARRAALGLTVDFTTAWNLMPWSWMIDYFTNVGDVIDANRNVVGAVPDGINIMVHTVHSANVMPITLPNGVSGGSAFDMYETKQRFVADGLTGFNSTVPILSNRQVSILGALAITRLPKRQ